MFGVSVDREAVALARQALARVETYGAILDRMRVDEAATWALGLLLALGSGPERADLEELDLIDEDGVAIGLLHEALGRPSGLLSTLQGLARRGLLEGLDEHLAVAWSPDTSKVRPAQILSLAVAGVEPPSATAWYRYTPAGGDLEA